MSDAEIQADTATVPSRFVVGIDLGTTNCAVAFVDTEQADAQVQLFSVAQLVAPAQVEARETLPSFHYEATEAERAAGAVQLPWDAGRDYAIGIYARDHGSTVPGRLISSAKSWLCHAGVDRTAPLLPWHGAADVSKLSPVEATARILQQIREAWDAEHPTQPLAAQDVIITLPASFDEVARELTVKAARAAGLPRIVLLEEPQAAFYAWINRQQEHWETQVQPGHKILVCDVGGGTSDLTLIRVRQTSDGRVQFQRVAVGDHLLLGGDNIDLALAHRLEQRLVPGGKLEARQWDVLVRSCRAAKEKLLGAEAPEQLTIHIPAAGARLLGGGLQVEVARAEVVELVFDGFLPTVNLDAVPQARRSGFQEFGLPFAPDAAISRYLAAFLRTHRHVALDEVAASLDHDPARPDVILFNGGFFASPLLRQRLLELLGAWFTPAGGAAWQPLVLDNDRLDLAVARGAAYYGMVRRGVGVRIAAGLPRAYYVGVHTADNHMQAMCLLPAGIEEGTEVPLSGHKFDLLLREPVEFPLFVSSTRLTDKPGEMVTVDPEQMSALPPIRTVLHAGRRSAGAETTSVEIHARLTEIGTLELWCAESAGKGQWRLQFDVRSTTETDREAHSGAGETAGILDEPTVTAARQLLSRVYDPANKSPGEPPEKLVKLLEEKLELSRRDWPPSLLRNLWEALYESEQGRRKSAVHEARWLNLVGFCLRPGYGMAIDDWRVNETWRLFQARKLLHPGPTTQVELPILWRRIAGGLSRGQQQALAQPVMAQVRAQSPRQPKRGRRGEQRGGHEVAELWRLLGSLELLSVTDKIELAELLLKRIPHEPTEAVQSAELWALGRIAARVPVYGPLNTVVPPERVAQWIERLLNLRLPEPQQGLALMLMARRSEDRYRDLPEQVRRDVLKWFDHSDTPPHYRQLVAEGGELELEEQGTIFGESLPVGLRISY